MLKEKQEFDAWYTRSSIELKSNPIGSYKYIVQWEAWWECERRHIEERIKDEELKNGI